MRGLRYCATLFFAFLMVCEVSSQQSVQWTQYMLHPYTINPAYAGLDRSLSITSGVRSQWSDFGDALITQMVQAHIPLYIVDGAAGIAITNDQLGLFRRTSATVSYNYVLDSPIGLVSTGIRFGGQQVSLDRSAIRTPGGVYNDNVFDNRDPRLAADPLRGFSPLWGVGFFLSQDLLDVGISVDNFSGGEAGDAAFSEHLLFSLYGSYQLPLTEILAIEPNLLIKSDGVQTQTDIGVLAHYNQFLAGLSVRGYSSNSIDAIGVIAGLRVNNHVRVSYSFDLGVSGLRNFHDGTHEFIFNYNLNKPIRTGELPRIIYNPRFN